MLLDRLNLIWRKSVDWIEFALFVKDSIDDARMKMEMRVECFAKALYESHCPESATLRNRRMFGAGENKLAFNGGYQNIQNATGDFRIVVKEISDPFWER